MDGLYRLIIAAFSTFLTFSICQCEVFSDTIGVDPAAVAASIVLLQARCLVKPTDQTTGLQGCRVFLDHRRLCQAISAGVMLKPSINALDSSRMRWQAHCLRLGILKLACVFQGDIGAIMVATG